ncbi:sulfatase family protein [Neorhodopirellula pilleata]|uniref:Arylsulfatase n=1 Tax=Neorhodopirellula pilleata TaxID=2714738 RepID=A0A5C6A8H2_9BACT|nr:sulfatase-like hydrolase/transferase [Neorhodopirellula pilleata]TWT95598.1 Arylsulfatase precursor [Neorhodopirellula pilleata]
MFRSVLPGFFVALTALLACVACWDVAIGHGQDRPNIVLVMADDLGYAQTGYYNHPLLRTPNLDALAENGLRLDRYYAAGPVCSPTRASVLTGRTHERTGVMEHGYALRRQESTLATAMAEAGYATGHFGKWHLDGLRGPGVPIFADDPYGPAQFGFQTWLSVTNFFDRDPLLSRGGQFESFQGDSSEIIVDEALKFARQSKRSDQPFFAVVWYGTPHSPFKASAEDIASLADTPGRKELVESMDAQSIQQYGELVAMDRSLGTLRRGLQEIDALSSTLIWFCSDNGGLGDIRPSATAPLRGHKGQLYEGGLRVPCVLHWPDRIEPGRVSRYPACAIDIAPTVLDLIGVSTDSLTKPLDGISLKELLVSPYSAPEKSRPSPIGFRYKTESAVVDNPWKLIRTKKGDELYNLDEDIAEQRNQVSSHPEQARRLRAWLDQFNQSVDASVAGEDYPEGQVDPDHPRPRFWTDLPAYQAKFPQWRDRWEYQKTIERAKKPTK